MPKSKNRKVRLFLHDDSVNTVDHVIETLSGIVPGCNSLKAESIAMVTHTSGKCQIYHGNIKEAIYLYAQLARNGLHVSVQ